VTEHQLTLAAGSVRCGSCLHIFLAADHWSECDDGDDKNIDDNPQLPPTLAQDPLFNFSLDSDSPEADDSANRSSANLSDSFINLEALDEPQGFSDVDVFAGNDSNNEDEDDDESWARALLAEIEQSSPEELYQATNEQPPGEDRAADTTATTDIEADAALAQQSDDTTPQHDDSEQPDSFSADSPIADRAALVNAIESEPVELHHQPNHNKQWLWSGLSLLMLLVLAGQYSWFNMASLSRDSQLRPWYQQVCDVIGCQLPPLYDINKISSRNIIVRPNTENAQLLNVDMIIINNAEFDQPYPKIRVTFSDINNTVISSRGFTKDEYLHGELSGSKQMPKQRQIHVPLLLVSPGDNAVNYKITFEADEKK
jgi:hypothetical protein